MYTTEIHGSGDKENGSCAWRLSSFSTFRFALTKNINILFKPYLTYFHKPIQWHRCHCGGCSFSKLFPETQAGWASCASWHLGFEGIQFQGSLPQQFAVSGNPWLCQELPVPVLTAQQHHTACAHLPAPKAGIPCSQGSWLRHPVPAKINSSVLMHCSSFQHSFWGKKGGMPYPSEPDLLRAIYRLGSGRGILV